MKRLLIVVLLSLLPSPRLFAQSAPAAPLDRTEILGRLALNYSPSYVAHLVKTRGLDFYISASFLDQVRQAGGAGILVDNLPNATAPNSMSSSADSAPPVEHLAECAARMHARNYESAEGQCRASIRENPASQWPYRVTADLLQHQLPPALDNDPSNVARRNEQSDLLQRAAALTPPVPPDPRMPKVPPGYGGFVVTEEQQVSLAGPLLDLDEGIQRSDIDSQLYEFITGASLSIKDAPDPAATPIVAEGVPVGLLARIRVEPDLVTNHFNLAAHYEMQARDFERAQSELREAIRLEPDSERTHAHLAVFYHRHKDFEGSLAELREVVRIAPSGILEHVALAHEFETAGRISDAIAEFKSMIGLRPDDTDLSDGLIAMYLNHHDHKDAIEELRRSLKATSLHFADEYGLVELRSQSEERLGDLLEENRELDAAAEQYRYLLRFKPDDADIHNNYGNVLSDQHRCDDAVSEYNEALRLQPTMAVAHSNIALCLGMKNDLDGAINELRQAIEMKPDESFPRLTLGAALAHKGDLKGATEQFHHVLETDPKDADAHAGFGFALMLLKNDAGAIPELKQALELKPDSPSAENNLAWIYAASEDQKLRNPSEALRLAHLAVDSSDAPNPAFIDTLAEALLLNGKADEALATETQAANLDPDNPQLKSRLVHFRDAADKSSHSNPVVEVAPQAPTPQSH